MLKLFRKQKGASVFVAKIFRGPGSDPPLPASWHRCMAEVLKGLRAGSLGTACCQSPPFPRVGGSCFLCDY